AACAIGSLCSARRWRTSCRGRCGPRRIALRRRRPRRGARGVSARSRRTCWHRRACAPRASSCPTTCRGSGRSTSRASAITAGASGVFSSPAGGSKAGRRRPPGPRAPRARRPTRDTSRVGTGRESGTLGDPRAPHVAAGESRRDRRGTPAPPTPLCEACPARRRLAASPLRRHPPIERCAPGAYPACRAGFASRGTAVARGTVPSRSRLAPTRDMSLGSRSYASLRHARARCRSRARLGGMPCTETETARGISVAPFRRGERSPSPAMRSATRLLLALLLLPALATRAFAADLVPCPGGDADCDDGDVCTLDTCGGSDGCRHDPVGLDAVRAAIDQALAVDACADASVPPIVVTLRQRAATLIDRAAATSNTARVSRLVSAAIQRLRRASRRVAAAGTRDRISGDCAGGLGAALGTATARAACLVGGGSTVPFACLAGRGPLVTLRGTRTSEYSNRSLASGTRIDARGATFLASSSTHYPISLDGGADVCLAGGTVRGQYDRTLDWATMHDMNNAGAP